METVRPSPEGEFPITKYVDQKRMSGGAGLVLDIARGLGAEAIGVGQSVKQHCQKNRAVLDGKVIYRLDFDWSDSIGITEETIILSDIPPDTEYVLLADYGKGIVTERLFKLLTNLYLVIVDPSSKRELEWYTGAYAIIPNRREANVRCVDEAVEKCNKLSEIFPNVCVKLDVDGMVITTESGCAHIKAHVEPREVVDVCGAGDAVLAAVGAGLLEGRNWEDSCIYGNIIAGEKCKRQRWE